MSPVSEVIDGLFPDTSPPGGLVSADAEDIEDLAAGLAGEHLVCAELLLRGHNAFLTDQVNAYDIVCDINGRLLRVQVKATRAPRRYPQLLQRHVIGYVWTTRRGKGGKRVYGRKEFDILALVALDTKQIAYMASSEVRQIVQFPVKGGSGRGKSFDAYTFDRAVRTHDEAGMTPLFDLGATA